VPKNNRSRYYNKETHRRNQPGILFGFTPERCSACPGIRTPSHFGVAHPCYPGNLTESPDGDSMYRMA